MRKIEKEYEKRMHALSPKERIARAEAMYHWSREIIARQITLNEGPVGAERLKWLVAMRQYGADSTTLELIRKALNNVPR